MPLIRRVCNWWGKQKWKRTSDSGLIHILGVPESEQNKFRKQSLCPTKAESKAIEWWLHHGSVSWRKLIHSLYEAEEFEVANDIRKYAEPPTGTVLSYKYWMFLWGLEAPSVRASDPMWYSVHMF